MLHEREKAPDDFRLRHLSTLSSHELPGDCLLKGLPQALSVHRPSAHNTLPSRADDLSPEMVHDDTRPVRIYVAKPSDARNPTNLAGTPTHINGGSLYEQMISIGNSSAERFNLASERAVAEVFLMHLVAYDLTNQKSGRDLGNVTHTVHE
ncbi:hypothetical protein D3C85_1287480 [compost metagenome]